MDIIGVEGVEAEAELLAAITQFFKGVGLTSADVGIKVSSRKVLQQVLESCGLDSETFGPVCILVDKLDKLPSEKVVDGLLQLGLSNDTAEKILSALNVNDVGDLETLIGEDNDAVKDLKRLFELAAAYGYDDYLVFDASVVRGLAYYTGVVFEGFDREGKLRAICGGGRYDKLLGTFGGEDHPCVGFGFGDAVIMELLSDKGLLPTPSHSVDDLVIAMDKDLYPVACSIASKLRAENKTVDLVLDSGKKMKWAFKQAERCGASRLVLVAPDEWEKGLVRVKNLETREEEDVPIDRI
jgi:histidyl-tRNA synthetase